MAAIVNKPSLSASMGIAGRERVRKLFSRESFAKSLDHTCVELAKRGSPIAGKAPVAWLMFILYLDLFVLLPIIVLGVLARQYLF